jgi:3-oxoacyl-[acyl-carrier protein] reductase
MTAPAKLANQVALVTGAAQGLGLGVARRLAADGARVVLADRSPAVLTVASELAGAIGRVCDVADSGAVDQLVAAIGAEFGHLDILVANAGIGGGGPLADMADDDCCRAAARAMIPRNSGVIVTVGSIFGRDTPAGAGAYGATKAGVVALTQALARELGPHGIRVNCISPGNMATDLHWAALERRAAHEERSFEALRDDVRRAIPLGRHGTPEDIGAAVSFLASPDAAYITGQTINVDGGFQPR